jgi:hypothetical protein
MTAEPSPSASLESVLDTERRQLQIVDALLGCLAMALEYRAGPTADEPDFADAVHAIQSLLDGSIERLDNAHLALRLAMRSQGVS